MPTELEPLRPIAAVEPPQAQTTDRQAKMLDARNPSHADAPGSPSQPEAPGSPLMVPNPALRLDHALGVVIMEFRDLSGRVSWTIPTARELAAYRATALTGAVPPPPVAVSAPPSPDSTLPNHTQPSAPLPSLDRTAPSPRPDQVPVPAPPPKADRLPP